MSALLIVPAPTHASMMHAAVPTTPAVTPLAPPTVVQYPPTVRADVFAILRVRIALLLVTERIGTLETVVVPARSARL